MKSSWAESVKLIDACIINPPKSEIKELDHLNVSFLPMADLNENQINFEPKQIQRIQDVYKGYTYFRDGDVLLAKVTPCFENGKAGVAYNLVNGIGFGSSEFIVLRPKKNLLPEYLYYAICTSSFKKEGASNMSGAVGLKRLTKDFLYNYEIPLPSIIEQQQVVTKLNKLFKHINEAIILLEEQIRNTKKLISSSLNEVFGNNDWDNHPFGNLVDNLDGKRKPIKSSTRVKGVFPYYGASGIIDYVEEYIFEGENLLVSEDGANLVMRTYPIAFIADGKYWVNNHAHVVKAKEALTSNRFLEIYFAYKDISDFITGAAQPKLSQKKLNEIPVALPSLKIQNKIVEYINKIESRQRILLAQYNERLEESKALKASILEAAFKGELSKTAWETLTEQSVLVG